MINFSDLHPGTLSGVDLVVEAIVRETDVQPDSLMLVGATCRDIMHAALGHTFPARSTTDLDLGIAAQEWNSWQSIHKSFPQHRVKRYPLSDRWITRRCHALRTD